METIEKIKKLYNDIPTFECRAGCSDCCGFVPWSKAEWEIIKEKRRASSLKCPYATGNGCDIYENRPLICRLFGTVNVGYLKCPHGCKPDKPLTERQARRIAKKYSDLFTL